MASRERRLTAQHRRLVTGLRFSWRDYRRNGALWVLLTIAVTPDQPAPVELAEGGVRRISILSMIDVHGAIIVPITVAFLGGLAGLFVVLGSAHADRRLVIAGYRPREVLVARLGVIVLGGNPSERGVAAVTALSFAPQPWGIFASATMIVALAYAMIGVVIGPLVGQPRRPVL